MTLLASSFPARLCNQIVRAFGFFRTDLNDVPVFQRFRIYAGDKPVVNQLVEVIVDRARGDEQPPVKIQIPVDCLRGQRQVIFGEETQEFLLPLFLTHVVGVEGALCITSEATSSETISPTFRLEGHIFPNKGKLLSGSGKIVGVCHELGVTLRLLGCRNRLAACLQQTSSMAQASMKHKNLRRHKTDGTKRSTDAVEAPAPRSLPKTHGASADVTAIANHARTGAQSGSTGGGGQHVPL